jgi:hypothetical protein
VGRSRGNQRAGPESGLRDLVPGFLAVGAYILGTHLLEASALTAMRRERGNERTNVWSMESVFLLV